jgi:hypothetical protein
VWGLGLILAIGTTMILAASLVVMPTLLHLAHGRLRAAGTALGTAPGRWTKVSEDQGPIGVLDRDA